jgi:hypothetical protein
MTDTDTTETEGHEPEPDLVQAAISRALVHDMNRHHEVQAISGGADGLTLVDHLGHAWLLTLEYTGDLNGYRADLNAASVQADEAVTARDEATRAELGAAAKANNEPGDTEPEDEAPADDDQEDTDNGDE